MDEPVEDDGGGLAEFIAREDAKLDEIAIAHPERALTAGRPAVEKGVKYANEIQALKAAFESAFFPRLGDFGRALSRAEQGAEGVPSRSPREPIPDPWVSAVFDCLGKVNEPWLLYLAFVELQDPTQREEEIQRASRANAEGRYVRVEICGSAKSISAAIRRGDGDLPKRSKLRIGPHVTGALLVAEHLGLLGPDESMHDDIQRGVEERIKKARKQFRIALQEVEFDSLVTPRLLVPPASSREKDQEAARSEPKLVVVCCAGAKVYEGIMGGCISIEVTGSTSRHSSVAWEKCSRCNCPLIPDAFETRV